MPEFLPGLPNLVSPVGFRGEAVDGGGELLSVAFPRTVFSLSDSWEPISSPFPEWGEDRVFAFRGSARYVGEKAVERGFLLLSAPVEQGVLSIETLNSGLKRLSHTWGNETRTLVLEDALSLVDVDRSGCFALGFQWNRQLERIQVLQLVPGRDCVFPGE